MKYLVIDTETGGLDPKKNALLEVGAMLFDEDGKSAAAETFNQKIMWDHGSRKTVSLGALGVNKFTLKDGHSPATVARELAVYLALMGTRKDVSLLGQNLQFDTDFISEFLAEYNYVGVMEPFRHRKVDTIHIGLFLQDIELLPRTISLGLKDFHKHFFGTDIPGAHTSLGDVKATFSVYREMRRLVRERVSWDSTVAVEGSRKRR